MFRARALMRPSGLEFNQVTRAGAGVIAGRSGHDVALPLFVDTSAFFAILDAENTMHPMAAYLTTALESRT